MSSNDAGRSHDRQYLTSKQVRARYGGISDMSLWRWLNDQSGFPRPMRIHGRRYWLLAKLESWEAQRNQEAVE